MDERKTHPVDATYIRNGDLMAFTYWVTVRDIRKEYNHDVIKVTDVTDPAKLFEIKGKELIESGASADQFKETQKISKTAAAQLLVDAHNQPFTVSFLKQDGQERKLRGRLVKPEILLGRSVVEDLDAPDKANRLRQVDHRTIQFLILGGVKYEVNKL